MLQDGDLGAKQEQNGGKRVQKMSFFRPADPLTDADAGRAATRATGVVVDPAPTGDDPADHICGTNSGSDTQDCVAVYAAKNGAGRLVIFAACPPSDGTG